MATTNKEIIAMYKFEIGMDIETPLNTYAKWKQMGYLVKRGEKSAHKITIWKPVKYNVEDENGKKQTREKLILKTAAFFTFEQVEKIEN